MSAVSAALGWTYTAAWSASFYPQLVLNQRRRDTTGLSFSFLLLNVCGFTCYLVFTASMLWSDRVRSEYFARYQHWPLIQVNDVVFAAHAVLLTVITLAQTYIYPGASGGRLALAATLLMTLVLAVLFALALAPPAAPLLSLLDVIYCVSATKIGITLVKYIPQVVLNRVRQSTDGWSVWQVVLDAVGGAGSLAQLALDSALVGAGWRGWLGTWPKWLLAVIGLGYDVLLCLQHWLWYRGKRPHEQGDGQQGWGALGEADEEIAHETGDA